MTEPFIARSLEELPALLTHPGGRLIAGGTTAAVKRCEFPIFITEVPNLSFIREKGSKAELGPLVTLEAIAASMPLRKKVPALYEAVLSVGTPELRQKATLGGNLSQDFIGSLALPLLAANAQLTLKTGADFRELPMERFYTADGQPNLSFDEILIKTSFSLRADNEWESFKQEGTRSESENHSSAVALRLKWDENDQICSARCFGAAPDCGYLRLRGFEKLLKGNRLKDLPKLDLSRAKLPALFTEPLRLMLEQAQEKELEDGRVF